MKEIYTNNGCKIQIVPTQCGIDVHHRNENNTIYDVDTYRDDEIVMALNLLHYMKDNGKESAYVCGWSNEENFRLVYDTPIRSGDLEEFRIFQ